MSALSDLQATLDASRMSWLASANDAACDFPIRNLRFGICSAAAPACPLRSPTTLILRGWGH